MKLDIETTLPSLALDKLKQIVRSKPMPQAGTNQAQFAAQAIANHLIFLIQTASDANASGHHSVAICLFRNMEDALDCFGAVALIPDAAKKWAVGELKASQAAILLQDIVGSVRLPNGETTANYRKGLRDFFNNYAHCTPYLIDWDLYPYFEPHVIKRLASNEPIGYVPTELRVNTGDNLLIQNGIRIGAYLVAHTYEFLGLVVMAYENYLSTNKQLETETADISNKLEDFLNRNWGAVYLDAPPPEIKNPRIPHPDDPNLFMELNLPDKDND